MGVTADAGPADTEEGVAAATAEAAAAAVLRTEAAVAAAVTSGAEVAQPQAAV